MEEIALLEKMHAEKLAKMAFDFAGRLADGEGFSEKKIIDEMKKKGVPENLYHRLVAMVNEPPVAQRGRSR